MLKEEELNLKNQLLGVLKSFWGYDEFRDAQYEIISSVLEKKDSIALLATGAGKSLCYQLPAIVMPGVALVVSPLVALMKDQVHQLQNRAIASAYISSEMQPIEQQKVLSACRDGLIKLLYVSPERLLNKDFILLAQEIQWSFLAVDEAHCISQWGSDFRPSYFDIPKFRSLFPYLPVLALTATASQKDVQEITAKLQMDRVEVFRLSFKRENLWIEIRENADKYKQIYSFLLHKKKSGIIYVAKRSEAESLCKWLQDQGLAGIDFYHAGLSVEEKNKKQAQWLYSNRDVLICTNAFGMGIDKQDVAFVIHLSMPSSLESYYQEIGRAGRDKEQAIALLLWNESEMAQMQEMLFSQFVSKQEFLRVINYVYSLFRIAENEIPESMFVLDYQKIQDFCKISKMKVHQVMRFLDRQEIVYLKEKKSRSSIRLLFDRKDLDLLRSQDSYFVELLLRNIEGVSSEFTTYFSFAKLASKISVEPILLLSRFQELEKKELIQFFHGDSLGIRFLKPRLQKNTEGIYWNLFEKIQKNKLQKWKEIKYFVEEKSICKMKLILAYFGEKNTQDCGKCSVCRAKRRKKDSEQGLKIRIFEHLKTQPMTLEDLSIRIGYTHKSSILEELKRLLEKNEIKMLNYKTYTLHE